MQEQLTAIGLTELQAKTYLYLLEYSQGRKPAQVAKDLGLTRTNAYKVLDQLQEYDLVRKSDADKTFRYFAEDPIALTSFVSKARNRAIELEKTVKQSLSSLQKKYNNHLGATGAETLRSKVAIIQAFKSQARTSSSIYFIKSRHDIPFMGYETMHGLRMLASQTGQLRFGITTDSIETPINPEIDGHANLSRTLIPESAYTSPVEWSVSANELLIVNYTNSGSVIKISDPFIATSFREIWKLLDENIQANPNASALPKKSARKV